jgi:hypothetical protein
MQSAFILQTWPLTFSIAQASALPLEIRGENHEIEVGRRDEDGDATVCPLDCLRTT